MTEDDKLGMNRRIPRRDFIDGVAVSVAVAVALGAGGTSVLAQEMSPSSPTGPEREPYPPARPKLRGSHDGSFEITHSIVTTKSDATSPAAQTDDDYDLIVVGAGISGLATAYFYGQQAGPESRILILDNHDDFGGHAKRNEFWIGDRLLIGYGGSQSISSPKAYSKEAKDLLADLGVDLARFYDAYDMELYASHGLGEGLYFDRKNYGVDRLIVQTKSNWLLGEDPSENESAEDWIEALPMSDRGKADLKHLYFEPQDYLKDLPPEEKINVLRKTSYREFLLEYAEVGDEAVRFLQQKPHAFFAYGADVLSTFEAYLIEFPGLQGLKLGDVSGKYFSSEEEDYEPYIFHFPDGNASIARLLVRRLIPASATGTSMDDIVTAHFDYGQLDIDDVQHEFS